MIQTAGIRALPWRLLYGGRSSGSVPFVKELSARTGGLAEQGKYRLPDIARILDEASPNAGVGIPDHRDMVLNAAEHGYEAPRETSPTLSLTLEL